MDVFRQIASVLGVFLLLGLAVWRLKRPGSAGAPAAKAEEAPAAKVARWFRAAGGLGARGRERALERMDRLALTPQHMLHLVRVQGRELVVATHPQGCCVLTSLRAVEQDARAGEYHRALEYDRAVEYDRAAAAVSAGTPL